MACGLLAVIAAKAARLPVVTVPEKTMRQHPIFEIAELRLDSLAEFEESHLSLFEQ